MKRPAASPDLARKALRLFDKHIRGAELAHRLKRTTEQEAMLLVGIGTLIDAVESQQLSQKQADVLKVIVRVAARNILMHVNYAKPAEVDFAGGFRRGTCKKQLVALVAVGFATMPLNDRITLTRAGWAFAWETGLIKPNWKVPA